jgi:alkylation response protein AidB-like acyl-CoA dehydrogenase
VRGIRHLTGRNEFAEVFLDDVRVPHANVVGGVDAGWKVINGLLKEERIARAGAYATFARHLQLVVQFMREANRNGRRAADDPLLRQKLGAVCVDMELLRIHSLETMQSMAAGTAGDADAPLTKFFSAETHQDMGEVFADAAGAAWHLGRADPRIGQVDEGLLAELQFVFLRARAETISGGSAQIQRNIIGERVLGLPRS